VAVPAEILNRPGKLTELQFALVKLHARTGFEIVKDIHFPWPVAQMVLQHHERLDGTGYPQGLKGDEIILEARILAVADVLEAMIAYRPYRPAMSPDEATDTLTRGRGTLFDAAVVDACLRVMRNEPNAECSFPIPHSEGVGPT
jgi:HD-GYP domain-containing protein (c-di-GMP phosphodiesterase class II)